MNLHRRHLNETQRAMIASKMAKLANGVRANDCNHSPVEIPTGAIAQTDAAKLLNVSRDSVIAARVVLERDTPEEVAGAEAGKLAVSTVANAIRAGIASSDRAAHRATPQCKRGGQPAAAQAVRDEAQDQIGSSLTTFGATR